MKPISRFVIVGGALLLGWLIASPGSGAPPDPEPGAKKDSAVVTPVPPQQIAFFRKNMGRVLVRECCSCDAKTAEKIRGGLTLDTRDGLGKGGDNGPALVPGDSKNSRILQALRHEEEN